VSANKITGAEGLTANPPACSTHPDSPDYYRILKNMNGIITVGTGGDYFSLTQAGGLFNTLNNNHVTGNMTVNIISDLVENGAYELNQWVEEGGSGFSLRIQPDATITRTINGTGVPSYQPMIKITGADKVTFDGGENKNLVFRNTSATPGSTGSTFHIWTNALSDTIRNCIIENNSTYTVFGSLTVGTTGPNQVYIGNNLFREATGGTAGPYAIAVYSGANSNSVQIIGNQISNFTTNGIYFNSVADGCVVSGNSLFNNMSSSASGNQTGILISSGNMHIVNNNYIGGQSALCGGSAWVNSGGSVFYGISLNVGAVGYTSVSGNTIKNISLLNAGTVTFSGIKHDGGLVNIGSEGANMIGDMSSNTVYIAGNAGNFSGIFSTNSTGTANIENNLVGGILCTSILGSPSFYGIRAKNGHLKRNRILSLGSQQSGLTPLVYGIYTDGVSGITNEVSNNVIALNGGNAANPVIYGYYGLNSSGSIFNVYYNSVNVFGAATTSANTYAYYRSANGTSLLKDNILSNSRVSGGTGKHYAIYVAATGNLTSDYNGLWSVAGPLGYYNSANRADLSAWKSGSGQDAHSLSVDPLLASNTNLMPSQPLLIAGIPITGINTDYIGVPRDADNPTIGAYEMGIVTKTLNLTVFLEGLYAGASIMNQAMDESGPHFAAGIADQVTVELHNATDYSTIEYNSGLVYLNTNGEIAVTGISSSLNNTYYITIRHRNSIEITTALPVSFAENTIAYAFDSPLKAFGNNLKNIDMGVYGLYGGDANNDRVVDASDLINVDNDAADFVTGYLVTDINGDGAIDELDQIIVENNTEAFVSTILP